MTCEAVRTDLSELADGTLGAARRQDIERHLVTCEACRAVAGDLRAIRAVAATLDRHAPPPAAWGRLQAGLRAQAGGDAGVGRASGPRNVVWLAAAAALLLATLAGVVPLVRERTRGGAAGNAASATGGQAPSGEELVQNVAADLAAAEAHYQKAIAGLEQIARSDSGALDPQVAAVLQDNLRVIDQAIGESRAALRTQPSSAPAQASLFDAMRDKVVLLQQTVELINEMRKGNQAEAGRLIEGLNR